MARDKENGLDVSEDIEPGTIADGLRILGTGAKLEGNWLRVFDIRYATAGHPSKITRDYVMFPAGSVEVLETGNLSEAATQVEVLAFPRLVATQAVIQAEICKPNKVKK